MKNKIKGQKGGYQIMKNKRKKKISGSFLFRNYWG